MWKVCYWKCKCISVGVAEKSKVCLRISVGRTCLMAEQLPLPQLFCVFFCIWGQYLLSCKRFLMILSFLWCAGDIMLSGDITVMSPDNIMWQYHIVTKCFWWHALINGDHHAFRYYQERSCFWWWQDLICVDTIALSSDMILHPILLYLTWSYVQYIVISYKTFYPILLYLTSNIQHWWSSNDCFLW